MNKRANTLGQTSATDSAPTGHDQVGVRQPMPTDPDYDSFWYEWISSWRRDRVAVAQRAKEQGLSVQMRLKANWDSCADCKGASGTELEPENAQEPPVEACTNPRGCQCTFVIDVELDNEPEQSDA